MQLYAIAMLALKLDPEIEARPIENEGTRGFAFTLPASDLRDEVHIGSTVFDLAADSFLAESSEDAKQMARERALEKWPEADGWTGHTVAAGVMMRSALVEALQYTKEDDDESDDSGPVM